MVVDFDPTTVPNLSFLRLHLTPRHGMMSVDVSEYIPLLEAHNFTAIKCAPTGHRMLSYVMGVKPLTKET